MRKPWRILAINPGSTSTKVALFEGDQALFSVNVTHDAAILATFPEISDQLPYREQTIREQLEANGFTLDGIDAFAGRGGGLEPLEGGTYPVNDLLLEHARTCHTARHPATLGSQLAHMFAQTTGGKAFVVNPPDVDEFRPVARITGLRDILRESRIHALNQKEVGIRYAASQGRSYIDLNLIICHIGGGVSVTAHQKGRMIDSNDIVNGDGPMAPTRSGSLPARAVVRECFSGKYTERQMADRILKDGGLVDHLGTSDVREVVARIAAGDEYARLVYDAMIYQIGKSVGAMAAALKGQVDAVLLTGGIARDAYLVTALKDQIGFIAPVETLPGEFEMEALASGVIRVLDGVELPRTYTGNPIWPGLDALRKETRG